MKPIRVTGRAFLFLVLLPLGVSTAADYARPDQGNDWWWDNAWWEDGRLNAPVSHPVRVEWTAYAHDDAEVPAMVARPEYEQKYPAVLFLHGRHGLDDSVQRHVRRLAARGFVVMAPDLCSGRFVEKFPR